MPQVLSKTVFDEVRLTLVAPEWPRAPWLHLFRRVAERQFSVDGPACLLEDGKLRPAPRLATVIDNIGPCKGMRLQAVMHRASPPCLMFFSMFDGILPPPSLPLAVFVYQSRHSQRKMILSP